jgi:hypothetical protein
LKYSRASYLAACILTLTLAPVALAHHGTANYDTTRTITVKGVVTAFNFENPHVLIFWDAKDDSGATQQWQGELTSPNRLSRVGWSKNSVKPGDTISISGYPTKSGSNQIWIQKVVMGDGQELSTGGS